MTQRECQLIYGVHYRYKIRGNRQVGVIDEAKRVLRVEAHSILDLLERIDESFSQAVDLLYRCKGRVVLMGMGKSGLIGRKIASTFSSTGTPAFFLHPAEGLNGDFGMLA